MKSLFYPDYKNTILNVSNSLLKYYGCETFAPSLPLLDNILANKEFRNIALVLVDAMGESTLQNHSEQAKNIASDKVATISSVFPPTTVAATTSVLTGKPPISTGWIGWMQYVRDIDRNVVFFKNKDYYDESAKIDIPVANTYVPVTEIYDIFKAKNPDLTTKEIFPAFREPEHDTFAKQLETLNTEFEKPGRHFAYVYWDQLDSVMHEFGPDSQEAADTLDAVDKGYSAIKEKLPSDSIVIMIADHGQIAVKPIKLYEYEKIWSLLEKKPSIESRAVTFWVKEGKKDDFEREFLSNFRNE